MKSFGVLVILGLVCLVFGDDMDMDKEPLINKTIGVEYTDEATWKVVGGNTAFLAQFPYIVSLRDASNRHFCGGSIINQHWILTAAHCMGGGVYPSSLRVVVGTNTLNEGGIQHYVSNIVVHPYHNAYHKNDIALVKVSTPIMFSSSVQPIQLGQLSPESASNCLLSGWGSIYLGSPSPNNLQYIPLNCLSTSNCQQYLPEVDTSQICTLTRGGQGACHGDSGGPLVSNGYLVGLVSYGQPCAKGMPDVYTRVANFYSWITSNMH